jgi:hypothetical protein
MRSTAQSPRRSKLDHHHKHTREAVKLAAMLDLITLIAPLGTATPDMSPRAGAVHCPDLALFSRTASKLRKLATSRDDDEQLRESMVQALALIEDAWATLPSAISTPARAAPHGVLARLLSLIKPGAGSVRAQVIHPLSPREREEALAELHALHARLDAQQPTASPGSTSGKRAAKDRPAIHHLPV